MKPYLELMKRAIKEGSVRDNRTGVPDSFVPGDMMKFDLAEGFPIMTTRKAAWKSAIGEMIAFIGAKTNAADFRALKCKFWDDNANKDGVDYAGNTVKNVWLTNPHRKGEDDLGEVYGYIWRHQTKDDGTNFDQFADAIRQIQETPNSRRIVVSGWMPHQFNRMALPPCHVLHQWIVDVKKKELHLNMFIRSNDLFLGARTLLSMHGY
jgi:thymidylate synthase